MKTMLRDAARDYMARGWHPVPNGAPVVGDKDTGKAPTITGWQNHKATEADLPLYKNGMNIGISCGPSRLVVLDFDAAEAYPAWAAAHPEAARTYTVARTNAEPGRCHKYYRLADGQPAPAQLAKVKVGWGDLKSVGGQVVAPPSVHSTGGRYVVTQDTEPLPWRPEYTPEVYEPGLPKKKPLVDYLPKDEPATPPPAGMPGIPPSVADAIAAGADEGGRNATAFFIAVQLRDEGWPADATLEQVMYFAGRCRPAMNESEVRAAVASAYSKIAREPAAGPEHTDAFGAAHDGRKQTMGEAQAEPWPEPLPLGGLATPPPPWPWDCFPATLAALGRAIVDTMNTPPELPGGALLGAVSIACRNVARIEIKADHHQHANLFVLAAMTVGGTKTPVCRVVQKPLLARQREMRERSEKELAQWAADARAARAQITGIERQLAKGDGDTVKLTAEILRLQAVETAKPCAPVLVCNDVTGEAAARIMARNGSVLGIFSSEARHVLSIARGRYNSQGADIGLYLAGHAGDFWRNDRSAVDKPSFELACPVLAAFLATQTDSLQTLGQSDELRESGFLARWIFLLPERAGGAEYPTASIEPEILAAYDAGITKLLGLAMATDAEGNACPHVVGLDYRAFGLWKSFHDEVKRDALAAPPLLAGCLSKLPEHAARVGLCFHLYEHAEAGRAITSTITPDEMRRAIELARCLRAHLGRAVAFMGETPEKSKARELWPLLDKHRAKLAGLREAEGLGRVEAVKPRDVARFGWAGLDECNAAREALLFLELRGWLKSATHPARVKAAPSHELFLICPNPAIPPAGLNEG